MNKVYRCGWCGQPTDEHGRPLTSDELKQLPTTSDKEDAVPGDCCINEHEGHQRVQVTREMAMDAGEPDMEGMWIDW